METTAALIVPRVTYQETGVFAHGMNAASKQESGAKSVWLRFKKAFSSTGFSIPWLQSAMTRCGVLLVLLFVVGIFVAAESLPRTYNGGFYYFKQPVLSW